MIVIERAPNFSLGLQMIIVAWPVQLKCQQCIIITVWWRVLVFTVLQFFGKGSSIKNITKHLHVLSIDCKLHSQQIEALVDHSALLCIFDFHISCIHVAWWEGLYHWPWARLPGVQHGGGLGGYEVLRDEEEYLREYWRPRGSNQDGHSAGYHGEKHSSEWMVLHTCTCTW